MLLVAHGYTITEEMARAGRSADKGLAQRMQARGTLTRITTDAQVDSAVHTPPTDTRAWFRGECMRRYAEHIAAASWDSVIFDVPGHDALQRVPTLEPLRGTQAHVGDLLDRCPTARDLLVALNQQG